MSGTASRSTLDAERLLDRLEQGELLAIVECQRLEKAIRERCEKPDHDARHHVRLLRRGIVDEREARHALGKRDEVSRPLQPVDEVSLQVAHARAVLDRLGPLVDVHAVLYLPPPGVAVLLRVPVARLALLLALRQRRKDLLRLPREDELLALVVLLVERLGADHRDPVAPAASVYLLERPALCQTVHRQMPHLLRELAPFRGLFGGAVVRLALRLLVPVSFLAEVALQLPPDCRGAAPNPLRYVSVRASLFTKRFDYDTLFFRQAVVCRSPGWGLSSFLCGH